MRWCAAGRAMRTTAGDDEEQRQAFEPGWAGLDKCGRSGLAGEVVRPADVQVGAAALGGRRR
jgi:hypothetical protein